MTLSIAYILRCTRLAVRSKPLTLEHPNTTLIPSIHRHAALTSRNGPFAKSVITHHYLVTLALFNNKLRSLRV